MNEIQVELQLVVDELTDSGVHATTDPGGVLGLVTQWGVCALVGPWTEARLGMGAATLELSVPVQLLTAGPYDLAAVTRLDEAMIRALPVLLPLEPVTRASNDSFDTDLPGLQVVTRRRLPYPLVVNPIEEI